MQALLTDLSILASRFAAQGAVAQDTGLIQGKVTDTSGAPILGAVVTVNGTDGILHMTVTGGDGAFQISSLAPGTYSVKISASGLSDWSAANVAALIAPESKPLLAVMHVALAVTTLTVGLSPEEVAAEQLNQEVKQRALGVLPNYYAAYEDHPAPLSPKQKLHLGLKVLLDPATFAAVGIAAGIQQEEQLLPIWPGFGRICQALRS